MRRFLAAALILLAGVGNAQAAVITFEDVPLDAMGSAGGDRTSGGFFFDSVLDHSHLDDGTSWGTSNGTHILVIDAFNGANSITFSPIGGGGFSLTAIDLSKANTFSTTSAENIEVTGNLLGGGTVFRSIPLSTFSFTTFAFDSSWTNLASVVLNGVGSTCCGPIPGNYFALDNVVVEATAVPEPGTLSLLALGSVCLFGRRRSRRRRDS